MRDAVELEWAGVPSVPVIHEAVRGSALSMAKLSGLPEYPFAILDYPWIPTAVWSDEEIASAARAVAPRVRELLCAPVKR